MQLLLSNKFKGKKILLLDSDTVFVGRVLDKIFPYFGKYDFIVSPEYDKRFNDENFKRYYYDFDLVKNYFPDISYPGFTFNTGCLLMTAGAIDKKEIEKFFRQHKYPYWTKLGTKIFPTGDQSLLNLILPQKVSKKELRWKYIPFMWWFKDSQAKQLTIADIKKGKYPYVVHWAGAKRLKYLPVIENSCLLLFFQKCYFERLFLGKIRWVLQLIMEGGKYYCWTYPRHIMGIEKIVDWSSQ
jgi:lipopolysaccharide biosynthesis glycosyltransferase